MAREGENASGVCGAVPCTVVPFAPWCRSCQQTEVAFSADLRARRARRFDSVMQCEVLDWLLAEQLDGRRPTSEDVAREFGVMPEVAEDWRRSLEASGELARGVALGRGRLIDWDERSLAHYRAVCADHRAGDGASPAVVYSRMRYHLAMRMPVRYPGCEGVGPDELWPFSEGG